MKDVIDKILKAEADAQDILSGAHKEAEHIVVSAQDKAEQLMQQAKKDAYAEKEAFLVSAQASIKKKYDEAIAQAQHNAQRLLQEKSGTVDFIAEDIFNRFVQ